MADDGRRLTISPSTLVPIGAIVVIVGVMWGVAMWAARLDSRDERLEEHLTRFGNDLERLEKKVDSALAGYMDISSFSLWVQLLSARNPELNVPEAK